MEKLNQLLALISQVLTSRSALASQVTDLTTTVAARDKTIADLQSQLAAAQAAVTAAPVPDPDSIKASDLQPAIDQLSAALNPPVAPPPAS